MARIKTREEKLAEAKQTIVKLEQETIAQAIDLRQQAKGWTARATELVAKAKGAELKADALLESIGQDPATFWTEHEKSS